MSVGVGGVVTGLPVSSQLQAHLLQSEIQIMATGRDGFRLGPVTRGHGGHKDAERQKREGFLHPPHQVHRRDQLAAGSACQRPQAHLYGQAVHLLRARTYTQGVSTPGS